MMKNSIYPLLLLFIGICQMGCSPQQYHYPYSYYAPSPLDSLRIAVLPYDVYTTGRIAEELTEEDILEIERVESLAFQNSLYHQMAEKNARHGYAVGVQLQHFKTTNRLIREAGYELDSLNQLSFAELAALLEVDAIVQSNVHKQVFLTDLEALGIELARQAIFIFGYYVPWYFPYNRTGELRVSSSIVKAADESTIWAASQRYSTDLYRDSYEAIERINFQMTRRMPL